MTAGLLIHSRRDALIWQCISRIHDEAWDSRTAVAELFDALERNRAAYYLGHDWLIDLLRETDVWAKWAAEEKAGRPRLAGVA